MFSPFEPKVVIRISSGTENNGSGTLKLNKKPET